MIYTEWEEKVTEYICEIMQVTYNDAAGFIEANGFDLSNAWNMGLDPKETADKLSKLH